MGSETVFEMLRDNLAIIAAFAAIVGWARQLELKAKWIDERLDRLEIRIQSQEESNHDVAVTIARQQETLNAILQRLDHVHGDIKHLRHLRDTKA